MPVKIRIDKPSNGKMENEKLQLAYDTAQKQKESGNDFYKKGNYKEALKYYSKAIQLMVIVDKREPSTHGTNLCTLYNNRAAAFTMLNKHHKALEDVNFALASDPTNQKCYLRKAKIQMEIGQIDDAENTYRAALVRDPHNSRLQSELQICCHIKEELDEIKSILLIDNDNDQQSKLPVLIFKESSTSPENVRIAEEKIDKISQLGGCTSDITIHMYKVQVLLILERASEADSICTKWLRKHPRNSLVLFWYAITLFIGSANLPDAQTRIKYLLHHDPDNEQAKVFHKLLRSLEKQKKNVDTSYKSKDYAEAVKGYTHLLKPLWCPKLAKLYRAKLFLNRAISYTKLEKYENAIQDFTDAIKLELTYVKAYMLRASAYIKSQNDIEKAIYDYEKVKEILSEERYQARISITLDADQQKLLATEVNEKLKDTQSKSPRLNERRRSIEYYKLLDLETNATDVEIRKAFRKMALKFHPDRHSENDDKLKAQQVFREITTAYEVLSDPSKRKRYDSGVFPTEFPLSDLNESTRNFAGIINSQNRDGVKSMQS